MNDAEIVDVSTICERVEERDDVDAADHVLTAIEERAEDGRITAETMADWHRECREKRRSVAEDVDDATDRLDGVLSPLDPADHEGNQLRARVDEYEGHLDAVRSNLSTVASSPTATRPESPVAAYEAADRLRECEGLIQETAHALHHLEEEFDEFETWLVDPEARIEDLDEEIDGFGRYLDNTEELLGRLETGSTGSTGPFDAWLAAYHLQYMMTLVFEELRSDIAELEAWVERQESDHSEALAALRDRLDTLEERHDECSKRLDAATVEVEGFERKREEVAESLERFEAALDDHEPPVDWETVEELVQSQFDDLGIELR